MKSQVKKVALLLLIIPIATVSYAQKKKKKGKDVEQTDNLVENGSFESTTGKIKKLGAIDMANGWSSPTGARADLYVPNDKVPGIGVPQNIYGKEDPKDGSNYVGIVSYSYNDKMPRSYIMTKLKEPLKKDQNYCVKFYVSLAELSKYSANQLGVHFSKKEFSTDAKASIIEETHVLHYDNKIFNANYNWDMVCGSYTAKGGEKYLTLGNFSNNDETKQERNKKVAGFKGSPIIAAYYYIDDVSVVLLEEGEKCDCPTGPKEEEFSTTIYQRAILLNDEMTPAEKVEAQTSFFAFGKTMLQPVAKSSLDLIADLMKENPEMKIEVTGYNDDQEDKMAQENPLYTDMDLKRVEIVVRYLKDKGIDEARIKKNIMGSEGENPEIREGDSDDLKNAKTRRVSYKVIQ
ncbi:MAG: OmpA family protein [Bacteroidetes bacterium]|nr:MAG: OmpA family protein [Bacteroidota bacterium]